MLRDCTLEEISDGRTYGLNDMVKADTGKCEGCSKCCTGMGNSIVLDPYDIWLMKNYLGKSLQELINEGRIELNMVDGLILPNLKMGTGDRCTFLNEKGRCSIHIARPGICRIFPLGRVYDENGFKYFLQKNECIKDNRAKIKVKKWIDADNIEENQKFILEWHLFIREVGNKVINLRDIGKGERINDIAMFVLNDFYVSDMVGIDKNNESKVYDRLINMIKISKESIDKLCG